MLKKERRVERGGKTHVIDMRSVGSMLRAGRCALMKQSLMRSVSGVKAVNACVRGYTFVRTRLAIVDC